MANLGQAFEVNCVNLDTNLLAKKWQAMNLPFLLDSFDWDLRRKLYLRAVKKIIQNSEKLRPIYIAFCLTKLSAYSVVNFNQLEFIN